MSAITGKTDVELGQLLDEYGIKHGPIVESTRKLYEKKLNEAMSDKKKPSMSDKTFYREEQEEVEFVTYHQPAQQPRHGAYGDVVRRSKFTNSEDGDVSYTEEPVISATHSVSQHSSVGSGPSFSKPAPQGSSPDNSRPAGVPGWLRLLVFLIIAVFIYYFYTCFEAEHETPFKSID